MRISPLGLHDRATDGGSLALIAVLAEDADSSVGLAQPLGDGRRVVLGTVVYDHDLPDQTRKGQRSAQHALDRALLVVGGYQDGDGRGGGYAHDGADYGG